MYERSGITGMPLFGDPNVDVNRAAKSSGSVWRLLGQVDPGILATLPQTPQSCVTLLPIYNADSMTHMSEMRQLQGLFAEANFSHSFLGRLPGELFNMILELVMQQQDRRLLATR